MIYVILSLLETGSIMLNVGRPRLKQRLTAVIQSILSSPNNNSFWKVDYRVLADVCSGPALVSVAYPLSRCSVV